MSKRLDSLEAGDVITWEKTPRFEAVLLSAQTSGGHWTGWFLVLKSDPRKHGTWGNPVGSIVSVVTTGAYAMWRVLRHIDLP